ncbi:unnamed protein product [Aureobasidium vineae]|uniref:Cryptic loci regulator 2 N-terminal domain-containing protein n=1 Tax=Aureobasidium vineae TaxID=2773715 RepID=A0A9N8JL00_9PEZI|nr:unnamed protein product [Aureobasidium vineae]
MANPNQAPPPGPNPGTITDPNSGLNILVRDIDLSGPMINSDGQAQQPPATDNIEFLAHLTRIFNSNSQYTTTLGKLHTSSLPFQTLYTNISCSGYTVNFIGGLPQGYVLESRPRAHQSSSSITRTDLYIRDFRSVIQFAKHVYHMMRNDLVNCDCSSC